MLANRTSFVSPSVTISISTKVKELRREGIDVIGLSIGEPDFFTPENIKEAGIQAIKENKTKYDAASGLLELKKAIQKRYKETHNLEYDLDEIVVSSGAKHSITNTLLAIINPEDEVIIPKPYWTSYPEMVKILGGVPILVNTSADNSFKLKPDELRALISSKTKAIFINNPSNPTGAIYTKEELEEIVKICIENRIYIIADEIYEEILFADEFTSVASLNKENTIVINGLSKCSSMTGWRIGYTLSNKKIAKAMSSMQGHLVSHPCTISQWAGVEAINNGKKATEEMVKIYKERRDAVMSLLDGKLPYIKPDGAFYTFIDISSLKEEFEHEDSLSIAVANKLLDEYKVAVVPGIAFGIDNYIRITFAADVDEVTEGVKRILKLANK